MRLFLSTFLLLTFSAYAVDASSHNLIIVRHGQATNNVENIYNSDLNSKPVNLTEKGQAEVKKAAQNLLAQGFNKNNIVAVFASPLPRGVQTAQILAKEGLFPSEMIQQDPRLTEPRAGDLEGKAVLPQWTESVALMHHGETPDQIGRRMRDFYAFIQKNYPSGNVVIVTHGGAAIALISFLKNQEIKLATGEALVIPMK